jgi:hypothetical protein
MFFAVSGLRFPDFQEGKDKKNCRLPIDVTNWMGHFDGIEAFVRLGWEIRGLYSAYC